MALITNTIRAERIVRHLASWGLRGGPERPIPLGQFDPSEADGLAHRHRVSGVCLAALDDGAMAESDAVEALRARLRESELRLLQQTLLTEADLVRAARALNEHGVEFRVLKGLATAHLDHEDPAMRATSDVDLLVRPRELDAATEALAPLIDVLRTAPDRRSGHTERYGKDRTLRLTSGGWLDLHRMVAPAYWGMSLDGDRFFDAADRYRLADTDLSALCGEHRLVHSILHAGYTAEVKLQSFRDVIVLSSAIDRDPIEVLSQPWLRPVRGLLDLGIERVSAVLDVEPAVASWSRQSRVTSRERLALRTRNLRGNREHWSGPLALATWRWPSYLLPLAVPSKEYLAWHGRSRIGHLASARRALQRRDDDA